MPSNDQEIDNTEVDSIEDDMSSLFDEIQERDGPEKTDRVRAPDGKFTKAEAVESDKTSKPEKTEKQNVEPVLDTKESVESVETIIESDNKPTETIRPPSSWSAAAKAKFSALDQDVKKEVLKREEDFHKGIESYKSRAALGDTLYKEIAPYEAMIRSQGSTPEVSIRNLLGVAYQLSTGSPQQKQQVIAHIAQMYGVQMHQSEEDVTQADPALLSLQQEVQRLRQERDQEKHQHETSTTATLSNEIEAFKADPKNIYFENVRPHMVALLQGGRATGLKDAYEQAIWANPEVRTQLLSQQVKEAESKRLEELKKTSIEARRAAGINTRPKSNLSVNATAGNTIDDTMSQIYDDIRSRQ